METWAMILNGIVMNTVYVSDSDYKYPPYTWVNITNYPTQYGYMPATGWITADSINFINPQDSNV